MVTPQDVYKDSLYQQFNPGEPAFIGAYVLPREANPFSERSFDLIALTVTDRRLPSIKAIPVAYIMRKELEAGRYEGKHTLVIRSSGNFVFAAALLARTFGFKKIHAIMATDVPPIKVQQLAAFGDLVDLHLVSDAKTMERILAALPGAIILDQYTTDENSTAHCLYTGRAIFRALDGRTLLAVSIARGSGGTAQGIGMALKVCERSTVVIGAHPVHSDRVPAGRTAAQMKAVSTLKQGCVDETVEVTRRQAFTNMRLLGRYLSPPPGPTSGLAFAALIHWLRQRPELVQPGGSAAFVCPDDASLYADRTTSELDPDQ